LASATDKRGEVLRQAIARRIGVDNVVSWDVGDLAAMRQTRIRRRGPQPIRAETYAGKRTVLIRAEESHLFAQGDQRLGSGRVG
jgi:hypothetical protein